MKTILLTLTTFSLAPTLALKTSSAGVPSPRHELPDAVVTSATEKGLLNEIASTDSGVPMHEVPAAAGVSWESKIPDIDTNLALAQQWMSVKSAATSAGVSPLATSSGLSGIVNLAAAVQNEPDHEMYYDCGLIMNTAWGAMARDPCSMKVWTASEKMKKAAPKCSKLRYGDRYKDSYQALLQDQDTWCGGPVCSPACYPGVKCIRSAFFPFSAKCEREVKVTKIEKKDESIFGEGNREAVQFSLAAAMVILFVALTIVSFKRR